MGYYLGVDGGGSKTAFALIETSGRVLARATAPTSYYFTQGFDVVEQVLSQGVSEVLGRSGVAAAALDAAFFGIPGYGEASADIARLDAVPRGVLGHERYRCDNDMVCGWAGSLAGADGINVISGTGSMTYGRRAGVGRRVGGWGELFGDEGSAYWIATQGLNAFSRMSDGRRPVGALHDLLRTRLGLGGDLDAVSLVIDTWGGDRTSIAALATTVCQAARAGDETSAVILAAAADEMLLLVETTRRALDFAELDTVAVSYSGGMFLDESFRNLFVAALRDSGSAYELRRPRLDPALGAALYAAQFSGQPLPAESVDRLSHCPEVTP